MLEFLKSLFAEGNRKVTLFVLCSLFVVLSNVLGLYLSDATLNALNLLYVSFIGGNAFEHVAKAFKKPPVVPQTEVTTHSSGPNGEAVTTKTTAPTNS